MEEVNLSELSDSDLRRVIKFIDIRNTRLKFATQYHRNTKGDRLEFDKFAHMRELYNTVDRRIVIMGGAQIGKTDWLVIETFACAYNGLNVFFVLPKFDMRDNFVQEKMQRPISMSPEYRAIIRDSTFARLTQTQFGKGIIKCVGASVPADFTSYSADVYCIDELDQCEDTSNIELGFSRMDQSEYKIERFVSNPTSKSGLIYRYFSASDQRKWVCPCDKCGEFSELDFFKSVVEEQVDKEGNLTGHVLRDSSWRPGCGRDISLICPVCGSGVLDRLHPDRFWRKSVEGPGLAAGYHMPSLISPNVAVADVYREFRDALENPTNLTRFYAMRVAVPFAAVGSRVSDMLLEHCADPDYSLEIHPGYACIRGDAHPGPCSMGVDVSPTHLDIRISAYDRGRRRMVYVGKIDPNNFNLLFELVERYHVQIAVIDIGPERLLSEDFQKNAKCAVWMCKYRGSAEDRTMKLNFSDMIISVDHTEALDRGYSQLKTRKNILPKNFMYLLNGAYQEEMCALVREIDEDKKTGNVKYSWVGHKHNHHRHADVYDLLAFELLSEDVLIGSECCYVG